MTKTHKATSQEQFLMHRKLTVQGLGERQWEELIQELNNNPGVDFAERKSGNQLHVTYDGTHYSTDELIELIGAHGGGLKPGWWTRRKLAGYRFTDENVRANAKHVPVCCSKMPPMKK
ncbi:MULTISPECIES: hypothetical protein [Marinobacter]|jgi:hypothetical protein|uniref:Uncharacterized protein n=3 Tax=Marinobacter TaxID=2742 RepID=A0A137S6L2_9GAMM|nr:MULTISPECIES: hypothetical protein [Marinobacter]MDX5439165.1 hypothetical protein [Alteromonadaceae bacterium]WBU40568.1 hypothetical protein PBN92_15910 [Marinobacter alkaliphilus]AMQ88462.1 hypothetical protein ASQ50_07005 [Marinobacter sp. LQ44]KXO08074.1 hypothetical protein J122_2964 [Marinobacter excellens LAMA 842]MAO14285.1 hypothetical protein [Marinobacter sp.]|tara:strand:+ start:203 stop:556 length:354 start_codon:yes stop_codon:yes gene_type:complete